MGYEAPPNPITFKTTEILSKPLKWLKYPKSYKMTKVPWKPLN